MKRRALIFYLFLTFIIIFPWLKYGYVLSLDSVFTPIIKEPIGFGIDYFYRYILFSVNQIIPSWIIEKIILFLITFLFFLGFYNLNKKINIFARLFCGVFGVFNAFFYYRFVTGEIRLLLAFSLVPFLIILLNNFYQSHIVKQSNLINIIKILSVCIVSMMIYPRVLSLIGITLICAFFIFILFDYTHKKDKKILLISIPALSAIILLNANNYLINLIKGTTSFLDNISEVHFETFTAKFNVWNIFNLTGSWIENTHRYLNPANINILWLPIGILFFCLCVMGIYWYLKKDNDSKFIGALLFTCSIFTLIIFYLPQEMYYRLCNNNVLFLGLRDPTKLYLFILLVEAFFASFFINKITLFFAKSKIIRFFLIFLIILPIVRYPIIPFGLSGQLQSIDYPVSYYELDKKISNDKNNNKILFLPWHQYMRFNYTATVIQNPAPFFFNKQTYAGDNLEIGQIYTQSNNAETQKISDCLANEYQKISLVMKELNIKYLILAKVIDWEKYNFLDQDKNLQLVEENQDYRLYINLLF